MADKVKCEKCGGTGAVATKYDDWDRCPTCHGSGERPITIEDLREAWHRAWDKRPGIAITKEKEECDTWLCTRYGIEET